MSMDKTCQNCKESFVIDEKDQDFYQKINVPIPSWCSQCRIARRLSTHNVWSVYWRNCDNCENRTLSMYRPKKDENDTTTPDKVYCSSCWWSDKWDGTEYAMDYDPNKNFFEQVYELSRRTPWTAQEVVAPTMVNSDYCNGASYLRNCYLTFWADYCENTSNCSIILNLKDSADCMRMRESELCYGSLGINKSYNTYFSQECDACTDVWFSRNCYNCTNCVGCVNLRGESYNIFNQKYTKEKYFEKIKEMGLDTHTGIKNTQEQAKALWSTLPYRSYTGNSMNLNVTGEYVFESKNSQDMYLCSSAEESRYCQFITVPTVKESYDYSGWGANAERMYESHSSGENVSNIKFSCCAYTDSMDVEYCIWTIAGKNNFGCVNLKRKKYCILNKEYSKEEYEVLKTKIIQDMKDNPYIDELGRIWTYGETFPLKQSFFGYNETTAFKFIKKTKEQALNEGFNWHNEENINYEITLNSNDLPQSIKETNDNILDEIIGCSNCNRGYKVGQLELVLLRKMNMPVSHECPKCRMNEHFESLNPMKLWKRNCSKCQSEINTAFSQDRQEVVYCEKCYQQEFV